MVDEILMQYGAIGAMCVVVIGASGYMYKNHTRERDLWREDSKEQHKEVMELAKQFQETTIEQHKGSAERTAQVVSVIQEMKGMLQK